MSDDYLWDRSGEPDPEIQELEQTLGALQYRPRELQIPATVEAGRTSWFPRRFAIAAAVALMVLGLGVWAIRRTPEAVQSTRTEQTPRPGDEMQAAEGMLDEKQLSDLSSRTDASGGSEKQPQRLGNRKLPNANARRTPATSRRSTLTAAERAEAVAAKEDLMMAMRLVSSKLSFAQKKTQGTNTGLTHNQHKIG